MAWVESHQEVGQHPKTLKAAKRLDINVPQMVGHLHLLWHWALSYADDGDLSKWDDDDLALGAQWDGDSGEFVRTLVDVGFVDEAEGTRWLHDWMEYAGRLVRERERKRASRSKTEGDDPPPDYSTSADRPRTGGGQVRDGPRAGTQPNPTQPNQPHPPPTPDPASGSVQDRQSAESDADDADGDDQRITDSFDEFWRVYPARHGKKVGKNNALVEWRKLTWEQRRRAYVGAVNLAASDQLPKDAERFLRRSKSGKGDFPFDDWQRPAESPNGSCKGAQVAAMYDAAADEARRQGR